jgi:hypothetical protein
VSLSAGAFESVQNFRISESFYQVGSAANAFRLLYDACFMIASKSGQVTVDREWQGKTNGSVSVVQFKIQAST